MSNLITSYPRIKIDEIRKALPFIEKKSCTFKFNPNTPNEFLVLIFFTVKTFLVQYHITEKLTYHIKLTKQECNFGKCRYWLKCPIQGCKKSVATLYLKHEFFACRTRHKLLYRSQIFKADFPFYRLELIDKLLQSK